MISADEALAAVLQSGADFGTETVNLLQSPGRMLAQPVVADRDLPPYHRVTMDGIAINTKAIEAGLTRFFIESIQAAGSPRQRLIHHQHCIEVMTGAVLPENTDAVIPYEQCSIVNNMAATGDRQVTPLQYVHVQGADGKAGELLVDKEVKITPAIAGILASAGWDAVPVYRLPSVAICSTGDELVDITKQPEIHQVRRSNTYALSAALLQEGIAAVQYHLSDNPDKMLQQLSSIIAGHEVILFSGAVSKGKYDYLPRVLGESGMQTIFHQVAQRPGKPFLFGKLPVNKMVFAFPGNPVSTFVCYHLYFRPWLYRCLHYRPKQYTAMLTREVVFKPPLACHLLVHLTSRDGRLLATPAESSGSGDLMSMVNADALMTLPAGRDFFNEGESFNITLLS